LVAAAVAAHHLWVDRIDLVAGGQHGPDQQATVGFDPHRDLRRVPNMGGYQGVQLTHARQPISDPLGGQHHPVPVQQAQVMVTLAPVHPKKQHNGLLCSDSLREPEKGLRRPNGSAHLARHPTSRPPSPNTGRGTVSPQSSRAPKPPSAHRLVALP
jgi:hypothetical protein